MNPSAAHLERSHFPRILLLAVMCALCGCSSSKLQERSLERYIAEQEKTKPAPPKPSIGYLNATDRVLAPGSADVYRLLEARRYKEARELASRMIESDLASQEEKAEYYLLRGVTNRLLVNEKDGFEDLNRSLELNPLDWRAYNARREAYENRSLFEKAKEDWEKAKELNPELEQFDAEVSGYRVHGGVI